MSPRAAWRLESWGYERCYDYVAGKMDWISFNLPYEGDAHLVAAEITTDAPTCGPSDRVETIDRNEGKLVVLNDAGIVMGVVPADAREGVAADVMREGPTTVRPSEDVHGLTERMQRAGVEVIVVTSSDGSFLGTFGPDSI